MSELHWFPFMVKDWLSSPAVLSMTMEQRGVYWHLLSLAWGNGTAEPHLPADDEELAILSTMGRKWWRSAGAKVRIQFEEKGQCLYNQKLSEIWTEQMLKHSTAVEKGRKGGKAKSVKYSSSPNGSSAKAQLQHKHSPTVAEGVAGAYHTDTEPDTEPEEDKKDIAPAFFVDAKNAYPGRPGGVRGNKAYEEYLAAFEDGADPKEILAGIRRYAAFCKAHAIEPQYVIALHNFLHDRQFLDPWTIEEDDPEPPRYDADGGDTPEWVAWSRRPFAGSAR